MPKSGWVRKDCSLKIEYCTLTKINKKVKVGIIIMYVDMFNPVVYMVDLLSDGTLVLTLIDDTRGQTKLYFKDTMTARKVIHDMVVELQAITNEKWEGFDRPTLITD